MEFQAKHAAGKEAEAVILKRIQYFEGYLEGAKHDATVTFTMVVQTQMQETLQSTRQETAILQNDFLKREQSLKDYIEKCRQDRGSLAWAQDLMEECEKKILVPGITELTSRNARVPVTPGETVEGGLHLISARLRELGIQDETS